MRRMKMNKKQEKKFWSEAPKQFQGESNLEYKKRLNIWKTYAKMYKQGMFK